MSEVTSFTIPRAQWLRGDSIMLSHTGCGCALGFYGLALGIPKWALLGQDEPNPGLRRHHAAQGDWPDWFFVTDEEGEVHRTCDVDHIIGANDASNCTLDEKEARIQELFAKHGVEANFEGEAQ